MLPEDSCTSVQYIMYVSLTAGFGNRPGVSRQLWPLSQEIFDTYHAGHEPDATP